MTDDGAVIVRVTRRFDASAERVFDAWLDAKRAARWLFATDTGTIVRAEIDARVGGSFTLTDRRDGQDLEHTGRYLVIERPRRLVFTFGLPAFASTFDRVTIEIVPLGNGCELTLTHEMKPEWAHFRERTENGWARMLAALDANLD